MGLNDLDLLTGIYPEKKHIFIFMATGSDVTGSQAPTKVRP